MSHLKVQVTKDAYPRLIEGTCYAGKMPEMSFLRLLGMELIARTPRHELADLCKEAFVLLAKYRNDKAAAKALEAVHDLVLTTHRSSPHEMKLSVEDFHAKRRVEEKVFFDWLEKTFWSLSFYLPDSVEERTNCEVFFVLNRALKETRVAVITHAAQFWAGQEDDLAIQAFEFLCDCYDSRRFEKRAPQTVAAIKWYHKRLTFDRSYYLFSIPKEDGETILSAIRAAMPDKADQIRAWGERTQGIYAIKEIHKLFGHALVNAGEDVFEKGASSLG